VSWGSRGTDIFQVDPRVMAPLALLLVIIDAASVIFYILVVIRF
jgi:hypothetical protein